MSPTEEAKAALDKADQLVREICPLLAGQPPVVQGSVVAKLAAMWISHHHPELRFMAQAMFVEMVLDLVPKYAPPREAFQQPPEPPEKPH